MKALFRTTHDAVHSFLLRRGILVTGYPLHRSLGLIKPTTVLDVGANVGQYGEELRGLGFGGTIHSFEPYAPSFSKLARAAAGSSPKNAWHVHNYGLGEREGIAELHVSRDSVFNSLRVPEAASALLHAGISEVTTTPIHLRTLDSVWDELALSNERVFLKMDTQGSELDVLRGGPRALRRVVGVQLEVSLTALYQGQPCIEDVVPVLRKAGLQFFGIWPSRGIRGIAKQVFEVDLILVRQS